METTVKKDLRSIPLKEDFMNNKNINDTLYGYYQTISYINSNKERFVYKSHINKTQMSKELEISKPTITSNTNTLIKFGYLVEGKVKDNYGNEVDCYYLPFEESYFQLIPNITLRYLIKVKSKYVIKIYSYLLNKYIHKRKSNEKYIFTKKELLKVLGYSDKSIEKGSKGKNQSNPYEVINFILNSLKNEGLINYEEFYYEGKKHLIPNIRLTFVGTTIKGMEKETQKETKGNLIDLNNIEF